MQVDTIILYHGETMVIVNADCAPDYFKQGFTKKKPPSNSRNQNKDSDSQTEDDTGAGE